MLEVDKATIEKTTRCVSDFECLSNSGRNLCPAEINVDNVGIFVNLNAASDCAYKVPFGSSHICKCPVRREIYQRYGI